MTNITTLNELVNKYIVAHAEMLYWNGIINSVELDKETFNNLCTIIDTIDELKTAPAAKAIADYLYYDEEEELHDEFMTAHEGYADVYEYAQAESSKRAEAMRRANGYDF